MSLFTDFVNAELPRRTVMTTNAIAGYTGNPNDPGAPVILTDAPPGTLYLRESDYTVWYKKTSSPGTWEMVGTSSPYVYTPTATEYWVDQAAGSDSNVGDATHPFATITKALSLCPDIINNVFAVYIKAGTYAETLNLTSVTEYVKDGSRILLKGLDWTTVTPATGPSSGTFDGYSGRFATLSTATWTVNDLRGRFVYISSGGSPHYGMYYPIASNTATGIEIPYNSASGLVGRSFTIVTPAATITRTAGAEASIYAASNTALWLESLTINTGSLYNINCRSNYQLTQCLLTGASFYNIYTFGGTPGVNNILYRCYVNPTAFGLSASQSAYGVGLYSCVFNGGGTASGGAGGNLAFIGFVNMHCIFQGFKRVAANGVGLSVSGTSGWEFSTQGFVSRDCDYGMRMYRTPSVSLSGAEITGNTVGILVDDSTGGTNHQSVNLTGCTISNNTSDGIQVCSTGKAFHLLTTTAISNNGRYGINLVGTSVLLVSGNHTVSVGASATMTGNVSGDFKIGDSAAFSIADLRAETTKTIIDTDRLNRVAGL